MPQKILDWAEPAACHRGHRQVMYPIGGINTVTGIDLDEFNRISGGFKFVQGGPFRSPDDILVDEYFAKERKLSVGSRSRC